MTTTAAITTTTTPTASTATTPPNYADLARRLTAKQAALGDGRDLKSDNEKALHFATVKTISAVVTTLINAADLARAAARLADATAARDAWLSMKAELTAEISTFRDWRLQPSAREREVEYERQRDLQRRLERLHRGTLYRAPGETFGTLEYLEERVAELTQRADAVRQRLDAAVADAERLLAEESPS